MELFFALLIPFQILKTRTPKTTTGEKNSISKTCDFAALLCVFVCLCDCSIVSRAYKVLIYTSLGPFKIPFCNCAL